MEFDRKGSFLERTVEGIFKRAGFNTHLNSKKFGFESDVIAMHGGFTIIIECKEYNSYLNIPSLLHQWSSKRISAKADRVIVTVTGIKNIPEKAKRIAKELDVILWDSRKINNLISIESKEGLREELNKSIKFDKEEFQRKQKERLSKELKTLGMGMGIFILVFFLFASSSIAFEVKFWMGFILFSVFFGWVVIDPKRVKAIENIANNFGRSLSKMERNLLRSNSRRYSRRSRRYK